MSDSPSPLPDRFPNAELVRDTLIAGRWRLELFDANESDASGKEQVIGRLTDMTDGTVVFPAQVSGVSPLHAVDSDTTLRSSLNWMTLRPGDTDDDHFASYTPEQMDFVSEHAEFLSMWAMEDPEHPGFVEYEAPRPTLRGLASDLLGVELDKTQQSSLWRPLGPVEMRYASDAALDELHATLISPDSDVLGSEEERDSSGRLTEEDIAKLRAIKAEVEQNVGAAVEAAGDDPLIVAQLSAETSNYGYGTMVAAARKQGRVVAMTAPTKDGGVRIKAVPPGPGRDALAELFTDKALKAAFTGPDGEGYFGGHGRIISGTVASAEQAEKVLEALRPLAVKIQQQRAQQIEEQTARDAARPRIGEFDPSKPSSMGPYGAGENPLGMS